jgi:hypothetical protein
MVAHAKAVNDRFDVFANRSISAAEASASSTSSRSLRTP